MTHCPLAPKLRSLEVRIALLEGEKAKPIVADNPPPPVRHEAWVNLYGNGSSLEDVEKANYTRLQEEFDHWGTEAKVLASNCKVLETKRGTWKTQCEEWAAKAAAWVIERDRLVADRDALITKVSRLLLDNRLQQARLECLHATVEAMKPVVDAAERFAIRVSRSALSFSEARDVIDAVRVYQNQQPASSESHDAMADKCCATCRYCVPIQGGSPCLKCNNYSEWTE